MNLENKIKIARQKANKKLIGERDVRKRLAITSKLEDGYSPPYPYARALGFKEDYDINLSHFITDGYVYVGRLFRSIDTLLEAGYEITIPEELANKKLNL